MRRVFTIITFFSVSFITAQTYDLDLELIMNEPSTGDTVIENQQIDLVFSLINHGPDTLENGFVFSFAELYNGNYGQPNFISGSPELKPGDTLNYTMNKTFSGGYSSYFEYCIEFSSISGAAFFPPPDQSKWRSCDSIHYIILADLSFDNNEVTSFQDFSFFDGQSLVIRQEGLLPDQSVEIKLLDMSGRQIERIDIELNGGNSHETVLPWPHHAKGVFLLVTEQRGASPQVKKLMIY
ncbi:MAG: hypothetical protein JJU02_16250 [Cryomorphaceae bacterium]|nr:hypothetical protein [Cryomorphaceae bacterium]